jgi:hypothetical protein
MTSYIRSTWRCAPADCPVEIFSELDGQRFETRKIEVFRDGRVGFASNNGTSQDTRLGIVPVPSLHEIRNQPEFEIEEITKEAFEAKWKAVRAR